MKKPQLNAPAEFKVVSMRVNKKMVSCTAKVNLLLLVGTFTKDNGIKMLGMVKVNKLLLMAASMMEIGMKINNMVEVNILLQSVASMTESGWKTKSMEKVK